MSPAIRPGTIFWTKDEDTRLIKLVMEHGKNWRYMRQFFPQRSESSIKCRWHVYLKQNVKGEPPEFKRQNDGVPRKRRRRKPKVQLSFSDDDLSGNYSGMVIPRKSTRKRIKPRSPFSPKYRTKTNAAQKAQRLRKYQELNILIPTMQLTGSITQETKIKTKSMLKRVKAKSDLELDKEEQDFFKQYCYSPRQGTPIADRIVATNCLASLFFTKDINVPPKSLKSNFDRLVK